MHEISKETKVQLSHSNWNIANRSPKRSPRENQTTQAWESQSQSSKVINMPNAELDIIIVIQVVHKTIRLAERAKELKQLETNFER